MTKSKILISFFILFFSVAANAVSIDSVFLKMPSKLIPLLTEKDRFEMLEYNKATQADSVKNRLDGFSYISYRDTMQKHIVVKLSANSTLDVKVFPSSDTTSIIGVIRTVCNGICNSTITFYNSNWTVVPIQLPHITSEEWLANWSGNIHSSGNERFNKLLSDNYLAMNFSKSNGCIEIQNNSIGLLSTEDSQWILDFIDNEHPEENKISVKLNCYLCSPFIEKLKKNE